MRFVYRIFLVHDDDTIEPVANYRFERLHGRRDLSERWPEHAGKLLRYAMAMCKREGDELIALRWDFGFIQLDSEGRHDAKSHAKSMRDMAEAMWPGSAGDGNVVGQKEMARRRYDVAHTWEPSEAVKQALERALAENRRPRRARPSTS